MMPERLSITVLAARLLVIAGATLSLAASCAQKEDKSDDAAFASLQTRLPGRYDNLAQVRSLARAEPAESVPALDLLIAPANAALIGKATFYVRETAAGDPKRVLSQYIWVFGRVVPVHGKKAKDKDAPDKAEFLEQRFYLFKEPQRWLRAGEQPEMLQSMLPEDLQRLSGCDLLWKTQEGGFLAERRSTTCSPAIQKEGALLEQRIELKDNQLGLLEQQITQDGLGDAPAAASDSYYRFVRRGSAN
jgi:hypothetical protein